MTTRIVINGFGRMGRLLLRTAWDWPDLEIVGINETQGDAQTAAHLLVFDSIHGRWQREVHAEGDALRIDGRRVAFTNHPGPSAPGWRDADAHLLLECSGAFRTVAQLSPYFDAGFRKVIVSAPVKQGALNIVMGVNHEAYDGAQHHLVTAASCTTNCLAPIVKVLHEGLGIRHGVITTFHDVTNTQSVIDAPHKDLRRARSALLSMIPTTTGSATAIGLIYPELQGRLDGIAVRVPILNASLTDGVFELARSTTVAEVNDLFREAARTTLKGYLAYEERPLVSADYRGDPHSAIVDAASTMVTNGTQVKVLAWYDNEMGYVHRLAELARLVAGSLT